MSQRIVSSLASSPHGFSYQWATTVPRSHQRISRSCFWSPWGGEKTIEPSQVNQRVKASELMEHERLDGRYKVRKNPAASGAFGHVYAGKCRRTGDEVAIKSMKKETNPDGLREIEMLALVDHPTVARFLDCFEDEEHMYLVTPYYTGGDLFDHIIENEGDIHELDAMNVCVNLLESVQATHRAGLAHLDVKPENFVYTDHSRSQLVLVDFGSAEQFVQSPYAEGTNQYLAGYDDRMQDISRLSGTAAYMPPEIARDTRFSSRSDVWGVGVILYVMLTGRVPYSTTKVAQPLHKHKISLILHTNMRVLGTTMTSALILQTGTPQEQPKFEQVAECVDSLTEISNAGRQIMRDMLNISASRRPSPSVATNMIWEHIQILDPTREFKYPAYH